MEKTLQCPKCGSTEIEVRDHDKLLKTTGGVLMTAAGTTAGQTRGRAAAGPARDGRLPGRLNEKTALEAVFYYLGGAYCAVR